MQPRIRERRADGWVLVAVGVLLAAWLIRPAHAGLSETFTVTNDYDFRGISQSAEDTALQGSVDFSTDVGWYIGAWASNVDFGDSTSIEMDLYTGFTGNAGEFTYDAGLVWYTYDESVYNFPEAYVSGAYGPFKGKLWYSPEFAGVNLDPGTLELDRDSESAFYAEGNFTFPLGGAFSLLLHAGYSFGDYWDEAGELASLASGENLDGEYLDYSVGVGGSFGKFSTTLKYIDTEADLENEDLKVLNNDRRVVLSVATTFPWD